MTSQGKEEDVGRDWPELSLHLGICRSTHAHCPPRSSSCSSLGIEAGVYTDAGDWPPGSFGTALAHVSFYCFPSCFLEYHLRVSADALGNMRNMNHVTYLDSVRSTTRFVHLQMLIRPLLALFSSPSKLQCALFLWVLNHSSNALRKECGREVHSGRHMLC